MTQLMADIITRWVLFIFRHGRPALILVVVTSAAAGAAAVHLFSLDSDVAKLIRPSEQTRWHAWNEEYKQAFPQFQDTAIVVVSGEDRNDVNRLTDKLVENFAASDWYRSVSAPGRDPFLLRHQLYYLETDELRQLAGQVQDLAPMLRQLDADPGLPGYFELLRQSLRADRSGGELSPGSARLLQALSTALGGDRVAWMASPGGGAEDYLQLIVLQGRQQFGDSAPSKALMQATRDIISQAATNHPSLEVHITGEIAMADEELQTALRGIQFAGILSLTLLTLILSLGVRSWSIVLAILTLLGCGVAWTSVYASLVVGSFNTLSLVFLVMFFGLGVDFALHYCLRIEEAESNPRERDDPMAHATRDIGTALLLCTASSGLAFLSFLPTEYRGLASLGVISAGGMLIAFLLTLTLIPAWFSVVGMPAPWRPSESSRLHFGVDQLPAAMVLALTLVIAAGAAWFARHAHFDYSVLAMRDPSSESMSTLLELQRRQLATDYSISVLAAPEQLEQLVPALQALDSVAAVSAPAQRIPAGQAGKARILQPLRGLGDLALPLRPPLDYQASLASRDLLLAELRHTPFPVTEVQPLLAKLESLEHESDFLALQQALLQPLFADIGELLPRLLAQPFTLEDLPRDISSRLISPDGRHLLEVTARDTLDSLQAMDRFVSEVESVAPNIAGRTVVERGIGQAVVRSFQTAIVLSLAGILLVLLLYFRELLTPVLVLIPLALTTLLTFAVIELTGLTLNMANILVVPLIFGLGVDTGVHVVHRYHGAGDIGEVLRSSTPRAVTLSALTTIGTFFSLSFSPHKGAASIGLILSVAIAILMLVTFVVLPALLALFEPLRSRD